MTRPKVDPEKRQRTAQACDSCKRRKQKCNGLRPCQTCEKRNLTCTYGTPEDASEESSLPKRRLIEATSGDSLPGLQSSESQIKPQAQQPTAWAPATDSNSSDATIKQDNSQSLEGLPNGQNEDQKSQPTSADAGGTQFSRSSTTEADEEADIFRNPRMLQDPTGRLLYIGDSGTLSFLQLIRMIVENVAGQSAFTMDPRRHRIVENTISLPPNYRRTHVLPDRETANVLVNSYFTNINGLIEVFHRKSFMTTLEMCYSDPLTVDPNWLCLLYLTFAIGLVMSAPPAGSRDDAIIQKLRAEPVDRAEIFYSDSKHLGDPSAGFEDAGLESVQALTLMSVYMLAVSKRNAAYAYHGMAVRSSFALGLHREETMPLFTSSEQSIRRNLWRSLFVLDRFLSASLGRPTSIRESDCSGTTLSAGEHNPYPQSPFPTMANANFTSTPALGLEASVRSCRVIGVILESIYSSRKISTKVAQDIAENCKGWTKLLDPSLDRRHASPTNPSQGIAILHVNLFYYHSIVLLTRPFFLFLMHRVHQERSQKINRAERRGTRMDRFAEACVMASSQSVALVQTALDNQYLPHRNPFVLYFLFASALVVIANEFSALTPNPSGSNTISNAINIMHYFAQHDTQGSRLLFILTSFRDVALREQATRSQQPGPEQQPVQSPPVPIQNDTNDPVGILLGQRPSHENQTATSPVDLNRPTSNMTTTSPTPPAALRRTPSYLSNNYIQIDSRNNSLNSLDTFFDLARVSSNPHSAGSENSDSLDAEIDFETLWQWPNSNSTGITPSIGTGVPFDIATGASASIIVPTTTGMGGVQGIRDRNVPPFGRLSADFPGP